MAPAPSQEDLDELQRELDKREAESKAAGLPFNRAALLRRIAQSKGRFYDSAEFILKSESSSAQPSAYFNTDIAKEQTRPAVQGGSRFQKAAAADDDDDDDDDE